MGKSKFKNRLFLLTAGIILGTLLFFGPSVILSILVLWSIFSFILKRPEDEKKTLMKIVLIALILRIVFFSIAMYIVYCANLDASKYPVNIVGHTVQVVRDFDREIKNGLYIGRYLKKGEFRDIPVKMVSHHGVGFLHSGAWTQGILNYLLGPSIFNLLLFPLIDLWAVVIIYHLAKLLFDKHVGAFSSFIYAIMPSTIVISCTNIRFSLGILSFLLIALTLLNFSRANKFKYLIALMASIILFTIFREKGSRPLLMILPFVLFMALNIRFRTKAIILIILAFSFSFLLTKSAIMQRKVVELMQNIMASQSGFISEGEGNEYRIYDEIVYSRDIKELPPSTLINALPKGLVKGLTYFMLVPFPWEVTNVARLYAYPQILFWYFIIPLAIVGMVRSLFIKMAESLPIIILCCYFIIILSLVMGNEGIAMRYRELITPFFYIFAGSILCKFIMPIARSERL